MPHWSVGRKESLSEYPIKNMSCLGIDVSEVFGGANWLNPVVTEFGLEISNKRISDTKYKRNYHELKKELKRRLTDYHNVFTHNPWGEYGHEEHIQVYRVVKGLQEEIKFDLWFSNYCSNKSLNLMSRYVDGFDPEYVTLVTDKIMADSIRELYKKNECWTWYEDWRWCDQESFIKDGQSEIATRKYGHTFPLNLIDVELPSNPPRQRNIFSSLISKISRNHAGI